MAKTTQVWEVYFDDGKVIHVDDIQLKEIMKDEGLIYLTEDEKEVINTKKVTGAKFTEQYDSDWVEPEPEGGD